MSAPADRPERAAAVREATRADREHYLTAGLVPVECGFCQATVRVKKLWPGHTAVQWSTEAAQRCAYFGEIRAAGADSARSWGCPRLAASIG